MKRLFSVLTSLTTFAMLAYIATWLLLDNRSPLPSHWNPLAPLDVAAPVTPFTQAKLRRAVMTEAACFAALDGHADFTRMEPLIVSDQCFIDPRLRLSGVGDAILRPVETTCAVALRLTMWERHSLRLASEPLGSPITALNHQSSYNCRPIRTPDGNGTRMSSHATAEAIDIRGITLADGRDIPLLGNWEDPTPEAQFWRTARDGACDWFRTTLGPEFNRLHADHFHLQSTGWGTCR